jgi:serine/threonine protein kinase, bacterial
MTVPVRIGPYVIERRLGGGGMAEVFLASVVGEAGFSRPVAIKRVLPGFGDRPDFAALFISEAKLSARLRHPNIVSVLDFQRDPEHGLFLVMELVEGKDLDQLLNTGLLPISLALTIAAEMLRGLGYAHHPPRRDDGILGLVHRDVSPQNVLLSWEGEVKVSDFGIAKSREAAQAAASVMIKGKPAYMSPEQADGRALDGRSDLFAVGVVLWQMLTGQLLFQGSTTQQVLAAVLRSSIPPPTTLRPDVPQDICAVVMKLLERAPAQRYATAEAALQDLLACRAFPRDGRSELAALLKVRFPSPAEMPTLVVASSVPGNATTPAFSPTIIAASPPPPAQSSSPRRSALRLLFAFAAALVAAAIATAGVAALVLRRESAPEQGKIAPALPVVSPVAAPARPAAPRALSLFPVPNAQESESRPSAPTSTATSRAVPRALASPPGPRRPVQKPRPTGIVEIELAPATEETAP